MSINTLHKGDDDDDDDNNNNNNKFTLTVCEERPVPLYSFCELIPPPKDG